MISRKRIELPIQKYKILHIILESFDNSRIFINSMRQRIFRSENSQFLNKNIPDFDLRGRIIK